MNTEDDPLVDIDCGDDAQIPGLANVESHGCLVSVSSTETIDSNIPGVFCSGLNASFSSADTPLLMECIPLKRPFSPICSKTKENTPLLGRLPELGKNLAYPDDPEYSELLTRVDQAIRSGIYPERISQGSSGSYFAKDVEGVG